MTKFTYALPALLAGFTLTMVGCTSETASSQRAIIQTSCASGADCPANFECEVEVEHGQTTSFCQSNDEAGSCPAGLELEVEHGQAFCKPHGGERAADAAPRPDDNTGSGNAGGGDDHGGDDHGVDDHGGDVNDDDHSGSGHR